MPGENKLDWSVTALSNGTADTGFTLVENQTRASLNDACRGIMAAEAKERNYQNGTITTGGTAAAQTFTSGVGFSAMPSAGMVVTLKMGFTNTAAFTLNMDGIGANTVKDQFGANTVGNECVASSYCTFVWNATNWVLIAGPISAFTTGDAKITMKTAADSGWVLMNDGTIGSASSAASTRASADCEALFTLLWNNVSDTYAPVVTGRGASAAADWAANKKLTLPRQLGRALTGSGAGSGLTAASLGEFSGAESGNQTSAGVTLATANLPSHVHGAAGTSIDIGGTSGGGNFAITNGATSTINTDATGSGAAFTVTTNVDRRVPRASWNVMIKL